MYTHTPIQTLSWSFPVPLRESESLKVAVYDHEHVGANRCVHTLYMSRFGSGWHFPSLLAEVVDFCVM